MLSLGEPEVSEVTADPLVRGHLAGLDVCQGSCEVQTQQGQQRALSVLT